MEFNVEQKKAIARLESAFKVCSKVRLYFAGVDNELHVSVYNFHSDAFKFTNDKNPTLAVVPFVVVNTFGSYIDSGGA